jgi:rRNA maturation endonuclease Nob1
MKKPRSYRNVKDEEFDLVDDPVLFALNKDIESVLSFTDNRLLVFLCIALAAVFLPEHFHWPQLVTKSMSVASVFFVVGGIGFTIYSVIKAKQKIAASYGLVCNACGRKPKTSQIMLVAQKRRCRGCGSELNVAKP